MSSRCTHPCRNSARACCGADRVSLFYDQAFIKEPGTQSATDWHQDLPFWPALGNDIVSLWVALTPVTVEGSGVEYVAGSHKWGKFYQAVTPDKDRQVQQPELEECPDFSRLKSDPRTGFSRGSATPATSSAIIRWSCMAPAAILHQLAVPRSPYAMREVTRGGIPAPT